MFFDSTMLLLIPAILLSLYAQHKVSSTFQRYQSEPSRRGMTGAEVAIQLLASQGIHDVKVEHVPGHLTDHYDPRNKVVRLSDSVYGQRSLAALGVAAHEVGHAAQHDTGYAALAFRSAFVPVANIGSRMAMPLFFIGWIMGAGTGGLGEMLMYAGIILFAAAVVFSLITLPVEFNASSRAMDMLERQNILFGDETHPAKKVLNAAALTYVAAAVMAMLQLLRFIMLARRR
jgi:Zn-dependent membrane protease YugP